MSSNTIHCEKVAHGPSGILSIQLDEDRKILYALTNLYLVQIDLKNTNDNVKFVYQHKRAVKVDNDNDDENYSQGEFDDDDRDIPRVSDPFDDSEPSTDDDEEKIINRRTWRRYGWRKYHLDNPSSLLFVPQSNQLIVLNEGVLTFLKVELEDDSRLFVQGPSKNIFLNDFDIFNHNEKILSVQSWSIVSTSTSGIFIFSVLDNAQLYLLDIRSNQTNIQKFAAVNIHSTPNLVYHQKSNTVMVYDSTQVFTLSIGDRVVTKLDLTFIEHGKPISSITVDKCGYIFILSNRTLFKCNYQDKFYDIASLGEFDVVVNFPQLIVTNQANQFYMSDLETGSIYRLTLVIK